VGAFGSSLDALLQESGRIGLSEPDYLAVIEQHGGNKAAAARSLGIPRTTLNDRLIQMERSGVGQVSFPDLPAGDVPIEEVIDQLSRRFERRHELALAKKWLPIKVMDDRPIGILWFGDPHLDDNGCNWPKLRQDVNLCRDTPGLYGANIGDATNNWSGRLARLYANQDTSKETARELVRWFMFGGGVNWLLWLMGNHDQWGDGVAILKEMGANTVWMEDWEAQFRLQFPNGKEGLIWAAHNFKGSSIWNAAHGNQRAAFMRARAHLYISGHLHEWSIDQRENPDRDHVYWLAKARGYKFHDDHARNNGFAEHQHGASIVTIFNPHAASEAGFLTCFADSESAADYLSWLRQKRGS